MTRCNPLSPLSDKGKEPRTWTKVASSTQHTAATVVQNIAFVCTSPSSTHLLEPSTTRCWLQVVVQRSNRAVKFNDLRMQQRIDTWSQWLYSHQSEFAISFSFSLSRPISMWVRLDSTISCTTPAALVVAPTSRTGLL